MYIAKKVLIGAVKTVVGLLIFLIFFVPFYWMVITSLKTFTQTLQVPPSFWIQEAHWENYEKVFQVIPFAVMIKNSLIVTFTALLIQAITVIPAAYAFARFRFRGNTILFGVVLSTMMIPAQMIFLPVFLMFSGMGLINSLWSIILPSATNTFAIFMLRQTFKTVPEELLEAARLDHASEWKIIWRIMLPIARPTVVTLMLISFINLWNDYFWPFVMTTTNTARTLPVGIAGLRMTLEGASYHIMMAGNVLLVIPVLIAFFFAQKKIIQAFTYMGEK